MFDYTPPLLLVFRDEGSSLVGLCRLGDVQRKLSNILRDKCSVTEYVDNIRRKLQRAFGEQLLVLAGRLLMWSFVDPFCTLD